MAASTLPKKGDILRFRRLNGLYYHFGIYAGDCQVIHRSGPPGQASRTSARSFSSSSTKSSKATIREDKLTLVAGDILTVEIANYLDDKKTPFSPDEIVERARRKVGEDGYDLLSQNCEHFATEIRYGERVSLQIDNAFSFNKGKTPETEMETTSINVTLACLGSEGRIDTLQLQADNKSGPGCTPRIVTGVLTVTALEQFMRDYKPDFEATDNCFEVRTRQRQKTSRRPADYTSSAPSSSADFWSSEFQAFNSSLPIGEVSDLRGLTPRNRPSCDMVSSMDCSRLRCAVCGFGFCLAGLF